MVAPKLLPATEFAGCTVNASWVAAAGAARSGASAGQRSQSRVAWCAAAVAGAGSGQAGRTAATRRPGREEHGGSPSVMGSARCAGITPAAGALPQLTRRKKSVYSPFKPNAELPEHYREVYYPVCSSYMP